MHIPKLTLRLLEPLGVFLQTSTVSSNAPVLIHLELRDVFPNVFFVSQRQHCIFLEGVEWPGSIAVRALNLWSTGCGFNSWVPHSRAVIFGKSFTCVPKSGTVTRMGDSGQPCHPKFRINYTTFIGLWWQCLYSGALSLLSIFRTKIAFFFYVHLSYRFLPLKLPRYIMHSGKN